jgi:hypothetical protein
MFASAEMQENTFAESRCAYCLPGSWGDLGDWQAGRSSGNRSSHLALQGANRWRRI